MGINAGSPVFILDDPSGDSWCMKSASLIVDPDQTLESIERLGDRLRPAPDWSFRTLELKEDLTLTPDGGQSGSLRTS